MSRAALLATILAAFSDIKGNLTEEQWNEGMAIVAAYLKAEAAACALVCRVQEKG